MVILDIIKDFLECLDEQNDMALDLKKVKIDNEKDEWKIDTNIIDIISNVANYFKNNKNNIYFIIILIYSLFFLYYFINVIN